MWISMWTAHQAISYFYIIQMIIFPKFIIWRRTWDTDSSESYFSTVQINISDWKIIEILWRRRIFLLGFEINNCRDSSLKTDIQKYSEKKSFPCDICKSTFFWVPNAKRKPMWTLREENPFSCEVCGSAFSD